MSALSRRRLVRGAGVVGAALLAGCTPLPWQAQQPTRVPRVGVVTSSSPGDATDADALRQGRPGSGFDGVGALRQGLRDLGYVEGQNIVLEPRRTEGRDGRFADVVAELVRLPVDIIVTAGEPAILAAREATDTIPIVGISRDPVASGLAATLARPGGNFTGLSQIQALSQKRLELLKGTVPQLSRVAALGPTTSSLEFREAEAATGALGVQLYFVEVGGRDELERAFATAVSEGAEAVLVLASPLAVVLPRPIADLALAKGLATISDRRQFADAGGLMAYGPSIPGLWRRLAHYVDRILKGAKPADLPVEQPHELEFVINLGTARALGLTIPEPVLVRATEVIP